MGKTMSKIERKAGQAVGRMADDLTRGLTNGLVHAMAIPQSTGHDNASRSFVPGHPSRFGYWELVNATNNFSQVIGVGGFSTVYKGRLYSTGEEVAVKKLKIGDGKELGDTDFQTEMFSGSANHRSMVRLVGFCIEGPHRILVYEYMANGSLDKWLFTGPDVSLTDRRVLDWNTRVKIAVGVAQALAYLHDWCRDQIMHFDIKPQNILLDDLLQPKLADFGAARLRNRLYENRSVELSRVMFTWGYVAPEVLMSVGVTQKSDVFSYGLVLLELISGRRNRDEKVISPEKRYFPAWAQHCLLRRNAVADELQANPSPEDELLHEVVDGRLGGNFNREEALRGLKTGLWCIQMDPEQRPSMSQVVRMLEGHEQVATPPANSGFAAVIDDTMNRSTRPVQGVNFFTNTSMELAEIQSLYSTTSKSASQSAHSGQT